MEDIGGLQKYLDSLPAEEKIIRKKAFRSLIKGRSLSVSSIIESLDFSKGKVHKLIGCLSEKGVIVFDSEAQAVVGSGGLSLVPTPHQLQVEDKNLFAWCAADAVGIPAALGRDALIQSICHTCQTPVEISLKKGDLQTLSSEDLRVYVVEADTDQSVAGHT